MFQLFFFCISFVWDYHKQHTLVFLPECLRCREQRSKQVMFGICASKLSLLKNKCSALADIHLKRLTVATECLTSIKTFLIQLYKISASLEVLMYFSKTIPNPLLHIFQISDSVANMPKTENRTMTKETPECCKDIIL